jgi:hypothetical protein
VESKDYLIWDADKGPNKVSGPAFKKAFNQNGYTGDYTTQLDPYFDSLDNYCAVFVCLGTHPDNTILYDTMEVVTSLVRYLNRGGKLYIEGGETWAAWDNPRTRLHERFHIEGRGVGGSGILNHLYGISGSFARNMVFPYRVNNSWIDSIAPITPAETLFINWPPYYVCAVSYEDPWIGYKTIGAAFEFGGLVDTSYQGTPVGAKSILADSIMHFFSCTIPSTYQMEENASIESQEEFVFPQLALPNPIPPLVKRMTPILPFR